MEMEKEGGAATAAKVSHIFKAGFSEGPNASQILLPERVWPYLRDGQPLSFLRHLLRVRAGVSFAEGQQGAQARPVVQRLEGELGAEQVADGTQGAAGVRREGGVSQQIWDQPMCLAHHRDVHRHAGARRLDEKDRKWA